MLPERTRHLDFGAVAAAWGMLQDLGVAAIIDEATGRAAGGRGRVRGDVPGAGGAEPAGRAVLQGRASRTGGGPPRRTGSPRSRPRCWITAGSGTRCTPSRWGSWRRSAAGSRCGSCRHPGWTARSVALDMTNFATFIDTANGRAPVAQRGKAKQKRSDLRLVGLGLVVTRDGGIPLTWHAYPGDRPDVTQFPAMIDQLLGQYQAVCAAAARPADGAAEMTVVFDAGQNSEANFAYLAGTGLRYVGSVPASRLPGPARPARLARAAIVDQDRFGGLTACDTRRVVYGAERRAILTHSPELHASPGPRVRRHHAGQGRQETGRAGRHPGPRQDPPRPGQGRSRDRSDHPQALGPPRHHLAADRRPAQRPAPDLGHRPRRPRRPGRGDLRQARADHRSRRLARRRGHRRLPVPVRGRVLLPPDERPPRGVLLPDAPLDRAQHPRPRLHLRPGPADRPPHAPARPGAPGCTCPSANCWASSPASARPS